MTSKNWNTIEEKLYHMVQSGRYAATKNNVPSSRDWALLEREVESFVQAGRKLDAKRRKRTLTYSQEDRLKLAKKEKSLLRKIIDMMVVAGASYTIRNIFGKHPDLFTSFAKITKSILKGSIPADVKTYINIAFGWVKHAASTYLQR